MDMSWIFTVALGIGIGYFALQALKKNNDANREEEFEAEENTEAAETTRPAGTKRLSRSATDKKLAGVCGGIAEYFGVDSTIVRLVFALLTVGWGSGVAVYIVAALVMPKAEKAGRSFPKVQKHSPHHIRCGLFLLCAGWNMWYTSHDGGRTDEQDKRTNPGG